MGSYTPIMLTPVRAALLPILFFAWGVLSLRVVYGRSGALLEETVQRLEGLRLEQVTSEEEDDEVQAVFDRLAVDWPALGQAWQELRSAIVEVEGRLRCTTDPAQIFRSERLVVQALEGRRLVMSPRVIDHLPDRLRRIGCSTAADVACIPARQLPWGTRCMLEREARGIIDRDAPKPTMEGETKGGITRI